MPIRDVVDLAGELLAAGHVVLAECQPPNGCWVNLCRDADEVTMAWDYAAKLKHRGIAVFARRKRLAAAIRATEARRRVETDGQRRMF